MIKFFAHDSTLAAKFNYYKSIEHSSNHVLSENYSDENFVLNEQTILCFYQLDEMSEPSLFSTIYRRDWWPDGCYRIINRIWQYPRNRYHMKNNVNDHVYEMIIEQIKWCQKLPNFRTAFISRQRVNRLYDKFSQTLKTYGYDFIVGPKLWVCKGSCNDCYQKVLYYGDNSVFNNWYTPENHEHNNQI